MRASERETSIGIWMTSAIVVGTIIGSSIFLLPSALAPLGMNAVLGWVVSGIGALCIAYALSRVVRGEGGGVQSYIEVALGPTAGFVVAFAFWVASWSAVAATAIAAAAALSRVIPGLDDPWSIAMVALAITIAVAGVNIRGIRAAGGFAFLTVAIRILPLLAVIIVLFVRHAKGDPVSPFAETRVTAGNLATAVTLTLAAITGFEAATTPVGKVRNPTWTIPAAMMAGTTFCVLLYLFSSTSISLILGPVGTAASVTPYADALKADWGEAAVRVSAIGIAIAAIGGLNSNLLCAGELGYSMALRGDLPPRLTRTSATNTPVISQLFAVALAAALVLSNTSKSTVGLFVFLALLTTTATLVVYVIGAVAALRTGANALGRSAILVSILFSLFAFYGAGLEANLWGLVLLLIGLGVRWLCHHQPEANKRAAPDALS
jgi:basic amino acid/polyamine antiporter, APA family